MAGPGRPKTGGRKKGVTNKVTKELKDMILGALDKAGGEKYLQQQAIDNPTAFMTLVGKVLPTTLKGDGRGGNIILEVRTGVPKPDGSD